MDKVSLKKLQEKIIEFSDNIPMLRTFMSEVHFQLHLPKFKKLSVKDMKASEDYRSNQQLNFFGSNLFKEYVAFKGAVKGGSLFNAISLTLYGTDDHSAVIKLLTLKYMIINYERLSFLQPSFLQSESFDTTLTNCALPEGVSSVLTVFCIAQTLKIRINLICLPLKGLLDRSYFETPKVYKPADGVTLSEVEILWIKSNSKGVSFQSFKPLLRRNKEWSRKPYLTNLNSFPGNFQNSQSVDPTQLELCNLDITNSSILLVRYVLNKNKTVLNIMPSGRKSNCQFLMRLYSFSHLKGSDGCGPWILKHYSTRKYYELICNKITYRHCRIANYQKKIFFFPALELVFFQYIGEHRGEINYTKFTASTAAELILNSKEIQPSLAANVRKENVHFLLDFANRPNLTQVKDNCEWEVNTLAQKTSINVKFKEGYFFCENLNLTGDEEKPTHMHLTSTIFQSRCCANYIKAVFYTGTQIFREKPPVLVQYIGKQHLEAHSLKKSV